MISGKLPMFAIEMQHVLADEGMPFPLYLHLSLNQRYVPVHLAGDILGQERVSYFTGRKVERLWIPESFRPAYEEFLKSRFGIDPSLKKEAPAPVAPTAPPTPQMVEPSEDGTYEETELVAEVLLDKELSQAAKSEILASLGQDLLRAFNQISNRGDDAKQEAVKRGRQIADEILAVASQDSNIYDEILALRQSQADIEHSIMVSTLSVMFGLALGLTDETLLADMATAGLFHDIGLTKVNPIILAKPENQWSAQDLLEYQEHVEAGIEIMKSARISYPETIFTMIRQHHENYDGSGFPLRLQGPMIAETSQLLHLANWFERLTSGKVDGEALSASDSLDRIFKNSVRPDGVKEVQPELIQRVFQFMLDEKEAADTLLREVKERVEVVNTAAKKAG